MNITLTRQILLSLLIAATALHCKGSETENKSAKVVNEPPPATATSAQVRLSDVNCWTEGDMFYAVGVVDSEEPFWKKFWLKIAVVDDKDQVVMFNKDSFCMVNTHASALPPRGRTAFLASWKLSSLNGTPDSIFCPGALAVDCAAGPILIATNMGGGVKVMVGDTATSQSRELYWAVNGKIENPLPMSAPLPAMSILLYGNDKKLWFSQAVSFNEDTSFVKCNAYGPMIPNEKRDFGTNIYYEGLPEPLRQTRIGRVDFLGYEKREQ